MFQHGLILFLRRSQTVMLEKILDKEITIQEQLIIDYMTTHLLLLTATVLLQH
jgi:hypothetical protein